MKRLLIAAAAIALCTLTSSAHAGCTDEPYSEEKENACNHGYDSAAFELCPGMTVGNAKLKAKLDAKYRNNPRMRKYFNEYYELAASQNPDKLSGVMSLCFTAASGDNGWIKWNEADRDQLVADEKQYSAKKEAARKERLNKFYGGEAK